MKRTSNEKHDAAKGERGNAVLGHRKGSDMQKISITLRRINALLPLLEAEERALSGERRAIEDGDQQEFIAHHVEMRVLNDKITEVFTRGES